jgi:acyl-CoA synthetase (AMP-forming)/AMP-acid ligase II
VVATHAAVEATQINTWFQAGLEPDEVFLHTLPASGTNILMATWNVYNGSCVVLVDKFDTASALESVRREQITTAVFVPTMLQDVLDHLERDGGSLPSLRRVIYGSAPSSPALIRRAASVHDFCSWQDVFPIQNGWTGTVDTHEEVPAR